MADLTHAAVHSGRDDLTLETDVLVIGGGPAGTWAALTAREAGAEVILVDKGYCGASGVGAAATIGHWWVHPDAREVTMKAKNDDATGLAERDWMLRVIEETWKTWPGFADSRGYIGDPTYRSGGHQQVVVQGPVYLREMRRMIHRAGVKIIDHAPALSLQLDGAGRCAGAEGLLRQDNRHWQIKARAVVMAAGGCALKSACIGSSVNTGDALLMAAELGARFSGMEFSNYYGIVPKGGTVDKNGYLLQAAFFDTSGRQIHLGWSSPYGVIGTNAAPLFDHEPVYCQFTQVPEERRPLMRAGQPNLFTQFDRLGIDPFTMKFEVEPVFEGSVRGSGGILVEDETCATAVAGLWVAGDAASREMLVGASSGAGAINAAWTLSSGRWAGAAAARAARETSLARRAESLPRINGGDTKELRPLLSALQAEVLPISHNGFRTAKRLETSISLTEGMSDTLRASSGQTVDIRGRLMAREIEAMLFFSRRSAEAALLRRESRGVHRRVDCIEEAPEAWRHLLVWRGLESGPVAMTPLQKFS